MAKPKTGKTSTPAAPSFAADAGPKITTGPVIGKVTSSSVRVLFEALPAKITVTLTAVDDPKDVHEASVTTTTDRPVRVVALTGLTPGTKYTIALAADGVVDGTRAGSIRTLAAKQGFHELVVLSCCDVLYSNNLHEQAYREHIATGSSTITLHVGDQVYGDATYHGCVGALSKVPRDKWIDYTGWILDQYRTLYRRTWNVPGIRKLLAHSSNLMIWDDHEITDDWADRGAFTDPKSAAHFVARCGWAVYREFQRQLWDDFNDAPDAGYGKPEHHAHAFDWLGILFIDNRGARAFQADPKRPYLGAEQWGQITSFFGKKGVFENVRLLIVVTPVPLVFMGPVATEMYDGDADDLFGHWSHKPYNEEQFLMLERLRKWKSENAKREVVVVGGDVHIGGLMTVRYREHKNDPGTPIYRELISSASRVAPLGTAKFKFFETIIKSDPLLFRDRQPTFSFTADDLYRRENYGVVTASLDIKGELHVALAVVESDT